MCVHNGSIVEFHGFSMDGSQSINNPLKKQRIVESSATNELACFALIMARIAIFIRV
jgi:hypothetical protein